MGQQCCTHQCLNKNNAHDLTENMGSNSNSAAPKTPETGKKPAATQNFKRSAVKHVKNILPEIPLSPHDNPAFKVPLIPIMDGTPISQNGSQDTQKPVTTGHAKTIRDFGAKQGKFSEMLVGRETTQNKDCKRFESTPLGKLTPSTTCRSQITRTRLSPS